MDHGEIVQFAERGSILFVDSSTESLGSIDKKSLHNKLRLSTSFNIKATAPIVLLSFPMLAG